MVLVFRPSFENRPIKCKSATEVLLRTDRLGYTPGNSGFSRINTLATENSCQNVTVPGARPRFIADIVFLMDSALDVGNDNYRRQKEFVKVIAKALNLGKDASRACLVVYNERARLVTTFNTHRTLKEFENALLRARHMSHGRRIDKALVYAADLLTRARREIPKVVVLITSGRRSSSNSLDVASNPLKTGGAKSFVVAIGNTPDIRELRLVVSKNDDVFEVPSFILLSRIEESFPKHIISSFGKKFILLQRARTALTLLRLATN